MLKKKCADIQEISNTEDKQKILTELICSTGQNYT